MCDNCIFRAGYDRDCHVYRDIEDCPKEEEEAKHKAFGEQAADNYGIKSQKEK